MFKFTHTATAIVFAVLVYGASIVIGSATAGLMGLLIGLMVATILTVGMGDIVVYRVADILTDRLAARKERQWQEREAQRRQRAADKRASERANLLIIKNVALLIILNSVKVREPGAVSLFDMDAVSRRALICDALASSPDNIQERENIIEEVEDAITATQREAIAREYGFDPNTASVRTLPDHLRGETLTIALNGVRTAARRQHQAIKNRRYGKFATYTKA